MSAFIPDYDEFCCCCCCVIVVVVVVVVVAVVAISAVVAVDVVVLCCVVLCCVVLCGLLVLQGISSLQSNTKESFQTLCYDIYYVSVAILRQKAQRPVIFRK